MLLRKQNVGQAIIRLGIFISRLPSSKGEQLGINTMMKICIKHFKLNLIGGFKISCRPWLWTFWTFNEMHFSQKMVNVWKLWCWRLKGFKNNWPQFYFNLIHHQLLQNYCSLIGLKINRRTDAKIEKLVWNQK